MPRGVDQVEDVALERQANRLALDGDAALALDVHPVEVLRAHRAAFDHTGVLKHPVGQRRLAVVDVRDDAEIAQQLRRSRAGSERLRVRARQPYIPSHPGWRLIGRFTAMPTATSDRLKAAAATVRAMLKLRRPRLGALNLTLLVVLLRARGRRRVVGLGPAGRRRDGRRPPRHRSANRCHLDRVSRRNGGAERQRGRRASTPTASISRIPVEVGDEVKVGDVLAYVSNSRRAGAEVGQGRACAQPRPTARRSRRRPTTTTTTALPPPRRSAMRSGTSSAWRRRRASNRPSWRCCRRRNRWTT